jgi:hypothetical protein
MVRGREILSQKMFLIFKDKGLDYLEFGMGDC